MAGSVVKDINGLDSFNYTFPAVRGIQSGREYYICMCPLKLVPRLFLYNESDLPSEMRAQRTLNRARIPEITNYIVNNPRDYVFSSITASIIDVDARFIPLGTDSKEGKVGMLLIPLTARFVINDGQHRRAAIEEALKIRPELGNETISVVLYIDTRLKRSQQIFSDLNRHAIRPTRSIGILYDHRDPFAQMTLNLVQTVPIFNGLTDLEKTSVSNRSTKLFTLSSIYQATEELLGKTTKVKTVSKEEEEIARAYWTEVTKHIPEWEQLIRKEVSSAELRAHYIHSHGIALHALGILGYHLINTYPSTWRDELVLLEGIDWARSNDALWEGRAMIGGRVSKARMNLVLTVILLKTVLELPLSPEEEKYEQRFQKQWNGGVFS